MKHTGFTRRLAATATFLALTAVPLPGRIVGARDGERANEAPLRTRNAGAGVPDHAVQGEYIGSFRRSGEPGMFGVQVIARGEGAFEAVGYPGGLPGAGWSGRGKLRFSGRSDNGATTLRGKNEARSHTLLVVDGRMEVRGEGADVVGRLERVVRRSPTLGQKPPPDAVVLFDGTTAEHFHTGRGDPAELTSEGHLLLDRGTQGLYSRRPFQGCSLHLEFRLPFEPKARNQGRANSGCYLQGRYEVQILDSFGLEGKENECGGIYSSHKNPAVNMCFPPLTWQTFDIDFTAATFDGAGKKLRNARLTVRHNGVEVYRNLEIDHTTTAAPVGTETPEPKPLFLQDHGHRLVFRNIWLVEH